jgi:hypothetical protein
LWAADSNPVAHELMKENMNPDPGSNRCSGEASDDKLREVLRAVRPLPSLPPRFQENVWRRIEDSEAPVKSGSRLDALIACCWELIEARKPPDRPSRHAILPPSPRIHCVK